MYQLWVRSYLFLVQLPITIYRRPVGIFWPCLARFGGLTATPFSVFAPSLLSDARLANPFEQLLRRFVVGILRHEFAAKGLGED